MNDPTALPPPDPDRPRHPIRVVAERTGLTPATLRAWERRYGVVEPGRSEGGQRLYSDGDVERLVLLRRVTDAGRAISSVAEFSTRRLEGMAAEDEAARASLPNPSTAALTVPPSTALTLALQAVERLDPKGLERLLRREVILMGGEAFLDDLVTPLLREIGSRWRGGTLRPAHEHAAVAVIKQILGWMLERAREDAIGRTLVVGTLAGEQHELGALLAATVAAMEGWQVLFLGHDLPPEEIALTVRSVNASAVGISVVNPVDFDGIPGQLQRLLEGLPAGALVILGGAAAEDVVRVAGDDRIIALPSLKEFRRALRNQD